MSQNPWDKLKIQQRCEPKGFLRSKLVISLVALAVVFLVSFVLWNVYVIPSYRGESEDTPVIVAETLDIKERPEPQVLSEGDSVYSLISQEKDRNSTIKNEVEEPLHASSFENLGMESDQGNPQPEKKDVIEERPQDQRSSLSSSASKNQARHSDRIFVQVGALSSSQEAMRERERLYKKCQGIIEDATIKIVEAKVPGKGIVHRLYVGPFGPQRKAKKMCDALKKIGVACFVVDLR